MQSDAKSRQRDMFVEGLFKYTLVKLGFADISEIHSSIVTHMRIKEIERKLSKPWLSPTIPTLD